MNEILLTNKSKISILYNDIIINSFKDYIDKIIYHISKSFVKSCLENRYYDSEKSWTQNISPTFTKLNISYTNAYLKIGKIRIIKSKIPNLVINEFDGKNIFLVNLFIIFKFILTILIVKLYLLIILLLYLIVIPYFLK